MSGRHLDNIAAALFGGRRPGPQHRSGRRRALSVPARAPGRRSSTPRQSCGPRTRPRAPAAFGTAAGRAGSGRWRVGALVAALASGDLDCSRRALEDRFAEPRRSPLLPGSSRRSRRRSTPARSAARSAAAGPTSFALARRRRPARRIGKAMRAAYRAAGVAASARVGAVDDGRRPDRRSRGLTSSDAERPSWQTCRGATAISICVRRQLVSGVRRAPRGAAPAARFARPRRVRAFAARPARRADWTAPACGGSARRCCDVAGDACHPSRGRHAAATSGARVALGGVDALLLKHEGRTRPARSRIAG